MIGPRPVSKQFEGKRQVTALDAVSLASRPARWFHHRAVRLRQVHLLNLVGGLESPSRRQVRIDGAPLNGMSDDELTKVRRDKIGFIFQFFNLLPTLSCLENVGLSAAPARLEPGKVDARRTRAPQSRTIGHRLQQSARRAVGRRAPARAIARALSIYPPILLATSRPATSTRRPAARFSRSFAICTPASARPSSSSRHDMSVAESCGARSRWRDGVVEDVTRSGRFHRSSHDVAAPHQVALSGGTCFARCSHRGHRAGGRRFVACRRANQTVLFGSREPWIASPGKTELQVLAGEPDSTKTSGKSPERVDLAWPVPGDRGGGRHRYHGRRQLLILGVV